MQTRLMTLLQHKGQKVFTVRPQATVLDAVRAMNRERIGALLVTEADAVVGIFTERDVLCRVVDQGLAPESTSVSEVMTTQLVTVRGRTTVEEAMAVVTERRCRHLPVMDDDRLLGLVSIGDLTRWVSRHRAHRIQELVNYITDRYPA
jgi:CBS domain-containing protein